MYVIKKRRNVGIRGKTTRNKLKAVMSRIKLLENRIIGVSSMLE